MKTLCHWRGSIISKHFKKKNCKWVSDHKQGKKQFCCKKIRSCKSRKCKVLSNKCEFTGKSVQWKTTTTCKWKIHKKYKQRICCYKRIKCFNKKNCRSMKEKCKKSWTKSNNKNYYKM